MQITIKIERQAFDKAEKLFSEFCDHRQQGRGRVDLRTIKLMIDEIMPLESFDFSSRIAMIKIISDVYAKAYKHGVNDTSKANLSSGSN